MKTCKCCKINKEIESFYKNGVSKKSGKQLYKPICKECYLSFIEEKRSHVKNLIIEQLGYYSCKICGYNKSSRALHLHHIDSSTKEKSVSDMWSQSDEQIKKEISKCVIVCANCHAEIHEGITELN